MKNVEFVKYICNCCKKPIKDMDIFEMEMSKFVPYFPPDTPKGTYCGLSQDFPREMHFCDECYRKLMEVKNEQGAEKKVQAVKVKRKGKHIKCGRCGRTNISLQNKCRKI